METILILDVNFSENMFNLASQVGGMPGIRWPDGANYFLERRFWLHFLGSVICSEIFLGIQK